MRNHGLHGFNGNPKRHLKGASAPFHGWGLSCPYPFRDNPGRLRPNPKKKI